MGWGYAIVIDADWMVLYRFDFGQPLGTIVGLFTIEAKETSYGGSFEAMIGYSSVSRIVDVGLIIFPYKDQTSSPLPYEPIPNKPSNFCEVSREISCKISITHKQWQESAPKREKERAAIDNYVW